MLTFPKRCLLFQLNASKHLTMSAMRVFGGVASLISIQNNLTELVKLNKTDGDKISLLLLAKAN